MFIADARHAFRRLVSQPALSAAAVVMLALAVGLVTAMFAVMDALLLRPVPLRDPGELASIYMGNERGGRTTVAPAVLQAWRTTPGLAAAESAQSDTALIDVEGAYATRPMAWVTPGLFALLGDIQPVRGRLFDAVDGAAGAEGRALLSESVWRGLFNADPGLVGRRVTIDGEPIVIVGILPADFRFPAWDTVLWRPIDFSALPPTRATDRPTAYVRFAADVPREEALRLATASARHADATTAELQVRVRPLVPANAYDRHAVRLLTGGVIFVFVVLCINVSSLLLGRLSGRRRDFGVCAALGASRRRLMYEAFLESSALGLAGVAAGVGVAWTLVTLAQVFLPDAYLMRTLNPLDLDIRALGIAAAFGLLAIVAVGLLPAWLGARVDGADAMRAVTRTSTQSRGARTLTRGLLVVEIAVACMLLLASTLLVRSFLNLSRADRGIDVTGVLTADLLLPVEAFPDRAARVAAAASIEERIRQLPGVQRVVWTYGVPPGSGSFSFGTWSTGPDPARSVEMTVDRYRVGADFFALYDVPLRKGRTFQPSDAEGDVIVGERVARTLWGDLDPIGRTFAFGTERFTVIGVAREIHYPSIDATLDRPEFYEPLRGVNRTAMMSVRCAGRCPDPAALRQRVTSTHAGVKVLQVRRLDDVYLEQLARPRAAAALGIAFAATAVLAAGAGIFCVLTFAVRQRRHEFGIRVALGASPGRIRRLVLRDGLFVALTGVAIGALAALSLGRTLASVQYGVTPNDPLTWAVVVGVLAIVALAAFARPVRDATRVDPVQLLKAD